MKSSNLIQNAKLNLHQFGGHISISFVDVFVIDPGRWSAEAISGRIPSDQRKQLPIESSIVFAQLNAKVCSCST